MICGTPLSAGVGNRLGVAREALDALRLDQRVDDEGAAGLPLALPAMAAMDEHRLRLEPVIRTWPQAQPPSNALIVSSFGVLAKDSGRKSPHAMSVSASSSGPSR